MHRFAFLLGGILLLTVIDYDWASKHRDRGGHRREHESLLDKQEREREKKDRKDDGKKDEPVRNITCYKCEGDACRDPFDKDRGAQTVVCEYNCWKGVFAATVRRSCGNKRCTFTFQGGSALSNTCCQTSECNQSEMKFPSIILTLVMLLIHRI